MIRWMRRISPCVEGALLGGIAAPFILLLVYVVSLFAPDDDEFAKLQWMLVGFYCLGGGLLYGSIRVKLFHPHSNEDVRKWLATTPWHWPQPLPFGPVELVLQDAIALLLATGWTIIVTGSLMPLILFTVLAATAYILGLSSIASDTGVKSVATGVGLMMAVAAAFLMTPWLAAALLIGSYLIARWSNQQSLKRIHEWTHQLDADDRIPAEWTWAGKNAKGSLGWPYATLSPQPMGAMVPLRNAFEASLLIGTWTWAACHLTISVVAAIPVERMDFSVVELPPFHALPSALGLMLGTGRWVRYATQLTPPLSLWGRLANRQFLLPGYDRVLIVPFVLVVLGMAISLVGWTYSIPLEAFLPVSLGSLTLVVMAAGPTLEEWRLTADGHTHPGNLSSRRDLLITQ